MANKITGLTYVTAAAWNVSYTTGANIDGAVLNVHFWDDNATNAWGGRGVSVKHPEYNGLTFASVDEAQAFAAEVGLLKVYVSRFAKSA